LAAEAKVEICEHLSVNFVELKRMRDAAIKKAVSDKEFPGTDHTACDQLHRVDITQPRIGTDGVLRQPW
jgi:hypothetical protein